MFLFYLFVFDFFFSGKESLPVSVLLATCPSPSICSPYHLSTLLSYCHSLPYRMSSVMLPILLLLTLGMTKTVSHLFQAHLYSIHKGIRQSLLYETEYIGWKLLLMTQSRVYEHQLFFCPIQLQESLKCIGCLSSC